MFWLSQRLSVLPNMCLLAWGWQRGVICVICGAMSALALPPFGFAPVLLLTFPCLVWLLDGAIDPGKGRWLRRARSGFALGWLFGFGYFLAGLWWIGSAFLVEAERFAWLLPFAVLVMPAGLALFIALGTALAAILWSDRFFRVPLLAACLTLSDWTRGHVFTGFPWNAFGYGIADYPALSQVASVTGLYGMTFLVVSVSCAPALLADPKPFQNRILAVSTALAVLVMSFVFGGYRLSADTTRFEDLNIRIVQPAIDQKDKWRPELRQEIFQTFLDMSEAPLGGNASVGSPRLVVWPESAVPFLLTQEPGALTSIGKVLGDNDQLVTGAVRSEGGLHGPLYFNSVYTIKSSGTVAGVYDKVRLVPFGEYLPMKSLIERLGITIFTMAGLGFEPGYQQRVLSAPKGYNFIPLVCYEAIFPARYNGGTNSVSFLLNVTNDAWFGFTPGPYQHFLQARLRAVETGLPMIRAANTGVSAVIDGKGRVVEELKIFEKGVIDSKLPARLGNTLYAIYGDIPTIFISIFIVVIASISKYNRDSRVN